MNLQEKSKRLFELRGKLDEIKKSYDEVAEPLKQEKEILQQEVIESLRSDGQFSVRYDFATITRAIRKTPFVENEKKIIEWLGKNKLKKEYTAIRLTDAFDVLAKEAVKTGKEISGLATKETEYISISTAKEGDKRKVIIE